MEGVNKRLQGSTNSATLKALIEQQQQQQQHLSFKHGGF